MLLANVDTDSDADLLTFGDSTGTLLFQQLPVSTTVIGLAGVTVTAGGVSIKNGQGALILFTDGVGRHVLRRGHRGWHPRGERVGALQQHPAPGRRGRRGRGRQHPGQVRVRRHLRHPTRHRRRGRQRSCGVRQGRGRGQPQDRRLHRDRRRLLRRLRGQRDAVERHHLRRPGPVEARRRLGQPERPRPPHRGRQHHDPCLEQEARRHRHDQPDRLPGPHPDRDDPCRGHPGRDRRGVQLRGRRPDVRCRGALPAGQLRVQLHPGDAWNPCGHHGLPGHGCHAPALRRHLPRPSS